MRPQFRLAVLAIFFAFQRFFRSAQSPKPTITLDEFLNTTDIVGNQPFTRWYRRSHRHGDAGLEGQRLSARSVAVDGTGWAEAVTRSGTDDQPRWSPDGKWIAFMSDRSPAGSADGDGDAGTTKIQPHLADLRCGWRSASAL